MQNVTRGKSSGKKAVATRPVMLEGNSGSKARETESRMMGALVALKGKTSVDKASVWRGVLLLSEGQQHGSRGHSRQRPKVTYQEQVTW